MSPSSGAGVLEAGIAVVERDPAVESLVQLNFCAREDASLSVAQLILAVLFSIDFQLLAFNLPTPISLSFASLTHSAPITAFFATLTSKNIGGGGRGRQSELEVGARRNALETNGARGASL